MCPEPHTPRGKTPAFYTTDESRGKGSFRSVLGRGLLLSGISLLVVFLIAETVTRIVYHPPNLGRVIQFDENLGWSLKPNSRLRSVDLVRGFDYVIDVNSFGMREREFDRNKSTTRILAIGDSFTFGTGVEVQWRFSDVMNRVLRDDVEVLNAGVPGWGTDQEVIHYETVARKLRPDVVILTIMMANDIVNNVLDHLMLRSAPKPRFVMESGALRLEKVDVASPTGQSRRSFRSMLKHSRFLVFIKRRIDILNFKRHARVAAVSADSGVEEGWIPYYPSNWSVYEREYRPEMADGWRVTEALIARLAARCDEDGAKLVVFAFPLKYEVDDEWRGVLYKRTAVDSTRYHPATPYRRLIEFGAANGIDVIYPLDEFREAAARQPQYFRVDGHPNRAGNLTAARVLLRALSDRGYIDVDLRATDMLGSLGP